MASHPSDDRHLTRRLLLVACAGGTISLAGCAFPGSDSDPRDGDRSDERRGTVSVAVTSDVTDPVTVHVGLLEDDASFDESVIATYTLGAAGDVARSTHDDVRGGPFRLVVRRVDTDGRDEFETTWDLAECSEFGLYPTIRDDEIAVTTACTHPPGNTVP